MEVFLNGPEEAANVSPGTADQSAVSSVSSSLAGENIARESAGAQDPSGHTDGADDRDNNENKEINGNVTPRGRSGEDAPFDGILLSYSWKSMVSIAPSLVPALRAKNSELLADLERCAGASIASGLTTPFAVKSGSTGSAATSPLTSTSIATSLSTTVSNVTSPLLPALMLPASTATQGDDPEQRPAVHTPLRATTPSLNPVLSRIGIFDSKDEYRPTTPLHQGLYPSVSRIAQSPLSQSFHMSGFFRGAQSPPLSQSFFPSSTPKSGSSKFGQSPLSQTFYQPASYRGQSPGSFRGAQSPGSFRGAQSPGSYRGGQLQTPPLSFRGYQSPPSNHAYQGIDSQPNTPPPPPLSSNYPNNPSYSPQSNQSNQASHTATPSTPPPQPNPSHPAHPAQPNQPAVEYLTHTPPFLRLSLNRGIVGENGGNYYNGNYSDIDINNNSSSNNDNGNINYYNGANANNNNNDNNSNNNNVNNNANNNAYNNSYSDSNHSDKANGHDRANANQDPGKRFPSPRRMFFSEDDTVLAGNRASRTVGSAENRARSLDTATATSANTANTAAAATAAAATAAAAANAAAATAAVRNQANAIDIPSANYATSSKKETQEFFRNNHEKIEILDLKIPDISTKKEKSSPIKFTYPQRDPPKVPGSNVWNPARDLGSSTGMQRSPLLSLPPPILTSQTPPNPVPPGNMVPNTAGPGSGSPKYTPRGSGSPKGGSTSIHWDLGSNAFPPRSISPSRNLEKPSNSFEKSYLSSDKSTYLSHEPNSSPSRQQSPRPGSPVRVVSSPTRKEINEVHELRSPKMRKIDDRTHIV